MQMTYCVHTSVKKNMNQIVMKVSSPVIGEYKFDSTFYILILLSSFKLRPNIAANDYLLIEKNGFQGVLSTEIT